MRPIKKYDYLIIYCEKKELFPIHSLGAKDDININFINGFVRLLNNSSLNDYHKLNIGAILGQVIADAKPQSNFILSYRLSHYFDETMRMKELLSIDNYNKLQKILDYILESNDDN